MLIGGDDNSNDVIALDTCFSIFVYICARVRFALIGGNLTGQSKGSRSGIGGGIQIPMTQLQALLPFPTPPPKRPESLHAGYGIHSVKSRIQTVWITCCDYLPVRPALPLVPESFHALFRVSVKSLWWPVWSARCICLRAIPKHPAARPKNLWDTG